MWVRSDNCLRLDSRWGVLVTDVSPRPKDEIENHEKNDGHEQHETKAELSASQSQAQGRNRAISTYTDKRDQVDDRGILGH